MVFDNILFSLILTQIDSLEETSSPTINDMVINDLCSIVVASCILYTTGGIPPEIPSYKLSELNLIQWKLQLEANKKKMKMQKSKLAGLQKGKKINAWFWLLKKYI